MNVGGISLCVELGELTLLTSLNDDIACSGLG